MDEEGCCCGARRPLLNTRNSSHREWIGNQFSAARPLPDREWFHGYKHLGSTHVGLRTGAVPVGFLSRLKLSALFLFDRNTIPTWSTSQQNNGHRALRQKTQAIEMFELHRTPHQGKRYTAFRQKQRRSDNGFCSARQTRLARLVKKPHSSVDILVRRLRSSDWTTDALSYFPRRHSRNLLPLINKAHSSGISLRISCLETDSLAEATSGRRMLHHSCRGVTVTTLHCQAWELLPHMPSIGEVDMARVYLQRPSNRTKAVCTVFKPGSMKARVRGTQ